MDGDEYYKLRLEHTIQHTQQGSKLFYLVNGGILAVLYFVARLTTVPYKLGTIASIIFVLALVNFVHGYLLYRQGKWYRNIDTALVASIRQRQPLADVTRPGGVSSHNLHVMLHALLAVALLLVAIGLFSLPDSQQISE